MLVTVVIVAWWFLRLWRSWQDKKWVGAKAVERRVTSATRDKAVASIMADEMAGTVRVGRAGTLADS